MLNICIQWLVMWQSWIYPLCLSWLIRSHGTVNSTQLLIFMICMISLDSKQYTITHFYDLYDISIHVGLHQMLLDHVIAGFVNCT